jgi:hypothetical protein
MRQFNKRYVFIVLLVVAALLALSSATMAANPVTNCTSTAELEAEIANGGTITFACGTATIPVTNDIDITAAIAGGAVTIDGGGTITFDVTAAASGDARAFDLTGLVSVTLRNMTITGGDITGGGLGGAIRVVGGATLNVENVVFTANDSNTGNGGAISVVSTDAANPSTVNVFRSAFLNNTTDVDGGVFSVGSNANLNVANSTFSGNTAGDQGGVLRLTGGGNAVNFTNNTFVNNAATGAGEVFSTAGAAFNLRNNIIVGAAAGETFCDGAATEGSGNLLFNGTCTGITPASTADPLLINNTAGANPHYALPSNSPAVNLPTVNQYLSTGTNPLFASGAAVTVDQLNQPRPSGGTDAGIDAGAFEFQVPAVNTDTPEPDTNTPEPATNTPDAPTETATTDPNVTPTETATTDPNVTPTETATTDPNVTPTETATTDPNVTPTETATTDPNVTPTTEATSTNTALPVPSAFDLLSPANGAIVRDTATVTAITWTPSTGADTYQFILFKLSDNTRLGVTLDLPGLTPAADADPLTCDVVCTLTVDASVQALLTDGQYAWTVFAANAFGETEASNAPFFFTVNTGNLNLIVNGGFESQDAEGKPVLDPWTPKNVAGDKIKCNKDKDGDGTIDKIVAFAGNCAFQFKGAAGENSKIQQSPAFAGLVNQGDTLTFSLYANTKLPAAGKIAAVKIKYVEADAGAGGEGKDKIEIVLNAPTANENYELFSGSLVVDGTINKLKVQVRNKNTSGKFFVDEVMLVASPAGSATATPEATATVDVTTEPTVDVTTTPDGTPTVEATSTTGAVLMPLP